MMQGTRLLLTIAHIVCALVEVEQSADYMCMPATRPIMWAADDCKATEVWGWPQAETPPAPCSMLHRMQ